MHVHDVEVMAAKKPAEIQEIRTKHHPRKRAVARERVLETQAQHFRAFIAPTPRGGARNHLDVVAPDRKLLGLVVNVFGNSARPGPVVLRHYADSHRDSSQFSVSTGRPFPSDLFGRTAPEKTCLRVGKPWRVSERLDTSLSTGCSQRDRSAFQRKSRRKTITSRPPRPSPRAAAEFPESLAGGSRD